MSTSSFYYNTPHPSLHMNPPPSHSASGRPRRQARSQAAREKPLRNARTPKEAIEAPAIIAFRRDFEAARSFDLEDDEVFCPFHLLTDDDLLSIHSSGSDWSSLSSGSPESSPLQHQLQPASSFVFSTSGFFSPASFDVSQPKLHQPLAQRTCNAIPIVDPSTRSIASTRSITSPPPSTSPASHIQQQFMPCRW